MGPSRDPALIGEKSQVQFGMAQVQFDPLGVRQVTKGGAVIGCRFQTLQSVECLRQSLRRRGCRHFLHSDGSSLDPRNSDAPGHSVFQHSA